MTTELPLYILTILLGVIIYMLFKRESQQAQHQNQHQHHQQQQQQQQQNGHQQYGSNNNGINNEMLEMQRTIRLLLEKSLSNEGPRHNSHDSYSRQHQERKHSPTYLSSPPIPTSPPSLQLPSAITPSLAKTEVPVDVYAEMKSLQESVKQLERRNRELSRQLTLTEVSNVVDVERKYGLTVPEIAASGVKLTPSEVETIRAIFNLFDTEQKGSISTAEIKALHAKLGEPLTESEAEAAIRDLDHEGRGEVNFHQFLYWWYEQHKAGKKSTQYTQRFQLIHSKMTGDQFELSRVITQDSGTPYTLEYRLNFYYKQKNSALKQFSPWHDVPLYRVGGSGSAVGGTGQILHMICEIPKWTRAKFECATGEPYNPIKQDTQHGKLRYYKHGDIQFNYGYLPQTWEDPSYMPTDTGYPGDNDPIDILDIGARQLRTGEICPVKILGVLALLDDGETDWKVIGISISDSLAAHMNDIDDVETQLPGAIKAIREYFRDYKSYDGKINSYALRAQAMPRSYALSVIEDTHIHWKSLHLVNKRDVVSKNDPHPLPHVHLHTPTTPKSASIRNSAILPPPPKIGGAADADSTKEDKSSSRKESNSDSDLDLASTVKGLGIGVK